MTTPRTSCSAATSLIVALLAAAGDARGAPLVVARAEGDRSAQPGDVVEDAELLSIDGRTERLLAPGVKANVLVFLRPGQERSVEALGLVAASQAAFAGKPVRFVGIASGAFALGEVRAMVGAARARIPVLLDVGDALYARLGVRLHPHVIVVDGAGRLVAWEPFREINYRERTEVRVRWLLGEVSEAEIARVDAPPRADTGPTDDGVARRHVNYARRLLAIGDHAQALEEVRRALALAPSAAARALEDEVLAAMGPGAPRTLAERKTAAASRPSGATP